ncbi:MAG: hypothetical protein IRZ16_11720, partial [Myxococcaceae bacterium]|nr:hypothetical protein [Myxococcaceae bacterium]
QRLLCIRDRPKDAPQPKREAAAKAARNEAVSKRKAAERDTAKARRDAGIAKEKRQAADTERRRYDRLAQSAGATPTPEQRRRLDRQAAKVNELEREAQKAEDTAQASYTQALRSQNEALQAEWAANDAAKAAGQKPPFAEANRAVDAVDAASLDGGAQAKLFGTQSVVSPQEAARADVLRIQGLALGAGPLQSPIDLFSPLADGRESGPGAAAKELERQLGANTDPAYREALWNGIRSTVDELAGQVGGPEGPQILRSFSQISQELPPTQGDAFDGQVAAGITRAEKADPSAAARIDATFKALSKDQEGAQFTLNVSNAAAKQGNTALSTRLDQVRPDLRSRAATNAGEGSAADAIRLRTVADDRRQMASDRAAAERYARREVSSLKEDIASGKIPKKDVTVENGLTTVVRRNKDGDVVGRQSFREDGDRISLDTVQFGKDGRAQREQVSIGPDGTTVSRATYTDKRRGPPPSWEQLRADETAQTQSTTYGQDGDGNPRMTQTSTNRAETITQTSTFRTQNDLDDINDEIEGTFVDGQPVDRVDTEVRVEPRHTDRCVEGATFTKPTTIKSSSFSQGESRVTSTDLATDGEDPKPRQWTLQLRRGNELRQEDLIEGNDDYRRTTIRRAEGNTVTETTRLNFKDEDGKTRKAQQDKRITFNDDGTVGKVWTRDEDTEGTVTEQRYDRTVLPNGDIREQTRASKETPNDGLPPETATQTSVTRPTRTGAQLVEAQTEVQRAGNTATYRLTPDGAQVTFTPSGGKPQQVRTPADAKKLPDRGALVNQARDGVALQLAPYAQAENPASDAAPGPNARQITGTVLGQANNGLKLLRPAITGISHQNTITRPGFSEPVKVGKAYENLGLDQRLRALQTDLASKGIGVVTGTLGLVGSAQGLLTAIQDGNALQIVANGSSTAAGTFGLLEGGLGIAKSLRGGLALGETISGGEVVAAEGRLAALARFGGRWLGPAGAALGLVTSGIDLRNAIQTGDTGQITGAAVGLTGAGALAVVGAFTLAGSEVPIVGNAVGAIIGTAVVGAGALIKWLDDDEHELPDVTID